MNEPNVKVLSGYELLEQAETPLNRDIFHETGGRLEYLYADTARFETHITVFVGERIVGIGSVEPSPDLGEPNVLWIKFVSVEEAERGNGIGRMIVEAICEYALKHGKKLHSHSFSDMGLQHLKPMIAELDARYPQCMCTCFTCTNFRS